MKFGQDYEAALARGEYPPDWVESAISYKKLKKCIKRVQHELSSLGLDKDTLDALWQRVGSAGATDDDEVGGLRDVVVQYSVKGGDDDGETTVSFTPRLTIVVDPRDGSPMDAWLSPDTRRVLRRLAQSTRGGGPSTSPEVARDESIPGESRDSRTDERSDSVSHTETAADEDTSDEQHPQLRTIEVPLTSDSEFFRILRRELVDLEHIQTAEQRRLEGEIVQLGHELRALRSSRSRRSREEVEAWRRIFELYADAEVFLSSHEADAGARDAARAQRQLTTFNRSLEEQNRNALNKLVSGRDATVALDRFLRINVKLLRLIRFQEINRTALTKIMKKFDKRTALHARSSSTFQESLIQSPSMAQDLARATCFTMSEELLSVIPQLNDYLCPVCFSVSWRPVRLRCGHLFCIRCLIVLQNQEQDHCPLCREEVVMEATSGESDRHPFPHLPSNFLCRRQHRSRNGQVPKDQLQESRQAEAKGQRDPSRDRSLGSAVRECSQMHRHVIYFAAFQQRPVGLDDDTCTISIQP
jgi:hypothetical protein